MRMLFTTLLYMGIAGVAFAVAHVFVRRWRPKPQLASQVAIVAISTVLMFVSVFLFTAWGLNPAIIQVNLQQSLNPLRWVPWLLSALNFGVAQAFLVALLRSRVEQARRVGALPPPSRSAEETLEPEPVPEKLEETNTVAVTASPTDAAETPAQTPADEPEGSRRPNFVRPARAFTARSEGGGGVGVEERTKVTAGEWIALAVLGVWLVVNVFALAWIRGL